MKIIIIGSLFWHSKLIINKYLYIIHDSKYTTLVEEVGTTWTNPLIVREACAPRDPRWHTSLPLWGDRLARPHCDVIEISLRILSCGFHFFQISILWISNYSIFEYLKWNYNIPKNFIYYFVFTTLFQISFDTIHPRPRGTSKFMF